MSLPWTSRGANERKYYFRHIKIFSTPAGTGCSVWGRDSRPGNNISLPAFAQHWGILVEDKEGEGATDTAFELNRPGGGIGVLKRFRHEREAEEAKNSTKIKYTNTGCVTTWEDDRIELIAQDVCRTQMGSRYNLFDANCQVMANLLVDRIAASSTPYTPYRTLPRVFGSGSAGGSPNASSADLGMKPKKLRGESTLTPPDWKTLAARDVTYNIRRLGSLGLDKEAEKISRNRDAIYGVYVIHPPEQEAEERRRNLALYEHPYFREEDGTTTSLATNSDQMPPPANGQPVHAVVAPSPGMFPHEPLPGYSEHRLPDYDTAVGVPKSRHTS